MAAVQSKDPHLERPQQLLLVPPSRISVPSPLVAAVAVAAAVAAAAAAAVPWLQRCGEEMSVVSSRAAEAPREFHVDPGAAILRGPLLLSFLGGGGP